MRHLNSARSRFMTQPSNNHNSRVLLKRLKETLSELGEAQARLDEIVKIIAVSMKSEVCSIYLLNRNNNLELYATEGLQSKAVHYSKLIGMLNHEPKFKFHDEIYTAEVNENLVSIHFPNIKNWQMKDDNIFINTGSPHHVLFKEDIGFIDVDILGKKLCENSIFTLEHTNVNFVSINSEKSISVRTYERGVNAETLSCGTGVVASVLSSDINNYISNKEILVKTKGGDIIVSFNKKNEYYENIIMSGKVQNVYSGIINL